MSELSPARLEANRANAQKSTGPTSPEGKAKSALNSLVHGLRAATVVLPGEDADVFEALRQDLIDEHKPQTVTEQRLLDTMAASQWARPARITVRSGWSGAITLGPISWFRSSCMGRRMPPFGATAHTDRSQDASHGQARRHRLHRLVLRIARRPAAPAESQTLAGRYRRHRRLWHPLRLRRTHRHPSLGQAPRVVAGSTPRLAQRHPLARLHPSAAHRA